ncbi:PREDICTED: keratin-associated protein 11-1 [Miniopterus natalensis]|uniref:keratin-associated protein 11-1 n=1 Tax=Miniopterus natalensis TaxID=291302 RepID=UPI0007A71A45|nr:PREDICTED: keratin-associated protein 11-1 [Miniopterus natalensis]
MSHHCSPRNRSARPAAGACPVPGVPVVPVTAGTTHDADCLSGICLPSSFQTGSWLLDHCGQEPSCEPPACQPMSRIPSPGRVACSRQTACVSSPCSAACSRPLTFVSSSCKPQGGTPAACQPGGGAPRTYKRPCVSSCRRTC